MISFSQLIFESISETPTKFGTNEEMDNGEIQRTKHGSHETFFRHGGLSHQVAVHDYGDVVFATSHNAKVLRHDKPQAFDFDLDQKNHTHNALGSFGKTMHVVHHLADHGGLKYLSFFGAHKKLNSVYGKMVKNKHFIKSMSDRGWKYSHKDPEGAHHFERVES